MTLEQITAAAVEVADEGGLQALSMASVAQRPDDHARPCGRPGGLAFADSRSATG